MEPVTNAVKVIVFGGLYGAMSLVGIALMLAISVQSFTWLAATVNWIVGLVT